MCNACFRASTPSCGSVTYHNPVTFLRKVQRARLNAATNNRYYLEFYDRMLRSFDQYMQAEQTWFSQTHPELRDRLIAYFSMEFGLHETLPIYAGGLGVLSGDHTKEASDLGLPFVAIGFFYTEGYFTQRITEDGWQEAQYNVQKFDDLPVLPILDENDKPLTISVELPGGMSWCGCGKCMSVGCRCTCWTPISRATALPTGP